MDAKKILGIALLIAGLLLFLILAPLALALALMGGGSGSCDTGSTVTDVGSASDVGPIPGKFIPFYQGAAARFNLGEDGPSMLAGIHFAETGFSKNIAKSGPYQGPMAITVAGWGDLGVDGDDDGKKDIMNEADAIYAAAKLLKSFGAPKDWRDDLASYNAGPANKSAGYGYADGVMKFAQKHHVPAAGSTGAGARSDCELVTGGGVEGYINPLNPNGKGNGHWLPARTDMGVDWQPVGEQPVLAFGAAEITYSTTSSGWPGGGFIVYRLLDGSHKGDLVYVAEHLKDLVPVGTKVNAGQRIATALPGYPWTEWGWNSAPDNDLARAHSCYNEGDKTNSGKEMARFFQNLGANPLDDPGKGPDFPTGPLC